MRYVQLALTEEDFARIARVRTSLEAAGVGGASDTEIIHRLMREGERSFQVRGLDLGIPIGDRHVGELTATELATFLGVTDVQEAQRSAQATKERSAAALAEATQVFASVQHVHAIGAGTMIRTEADLRNFLERMRGGFNHMGNVLHVVIAWAHEDAPATNPKGVN